MIDHHTNHSYLQLRVRQLADTELVRVTTGEVTSGRSASTDIFSVNLIKGELAIWIVNKQWESLHYTTKPIIDEWMGIELVIYEDADWVQSHATKVRLSHVE